uniref:glycosyltransferase family 4 protein n=1 Tax=Phocaeicola coprophilus TaxID=387090 RepID=UPI00307A4FF6
MSRYIISRALSDKVLMIGVYYKHNAPGGMAAVVQYYSQYIELLHYIPSWKLTNILGRAWYAISAFTKIVIESLFNRKIKILHIHFAADGSFWRMEKFLKAGKFFGKKVVLHCHSSRFKDYYNESSIDKKRWIVQTLLKADVLIVLSESWKSWFKSIGVSEEKITVLHNITSYPIQRQHLKIKDGKLHLLFLGEIGKRKGVFDVLRALAKNRSFYDGKIELRIGGNRNEKLLLDTIHNNKLENIVKFEGWVYGEKKINLFNWADVFILPSFNEGLPISILEAMSYGMPIISSPVGGIPEIVKGNGTLVTPGVDIEINKGIRKYIDYPFLIKEEGKISLQIVETYLPEYVMNCLKQIYERLSA